MKTLITKILAVLLLLVDYTCGITDVFDNTKVANGVLQLNIGDFRSCLDECIRTNCAGIDYTFTQNRCYHHTAATECAVLVNNISYTHYRFIDCSKTTVASPVGSPAAPPTTAKSITAPAISTIASFNDVHIQGGTRISGVPSLNSCYQLCYISATCQSFDWYSNQCFVHKNNTACNDLMVKQGSDHYRIKANCNPVPANCFSVDFQTFSQFSRSGGQRIATNVNFGQCQQLCRSRSACQAVDWQSNQQACYEHTSTGLPQPNNCCNHARKLCRDGTTQMPGISTSRATVMAARGPTTRPTPITTPGVIIPDNGKCPSELLAVPSTRSPAGVALPGIMDADACKAWCLTNANCVNVDFDNVATTGVRCRYHDNTTFDVALAVNNSCCTQYRKLAPCETKRCWTMPRQAVTSNMTLGSITIYQPIDELFNLDFNFTQSDISLDPCTGLCRIEARYSRNTVTGDISPLSPTEVERSCFTGLTSPNTDNKNCDVMVTSSANNTESISHTCYCRSDQCNAIWLQVIQACIVHYALDCNTLDDTFAQRHGQGFNLIYSGVDQTKNYSAIFDGTAFIKVDTFMNRVLGMVGPGNTIQADFTLLFWFKFTNKDVNNMTIISNGPHGQASLDIMTSYLNDTHRDITATTRINGKLFSGTVGPPYDKWQYFALRIVPGVSNYDMLLDVGDSSQLTDSVNVQTDILISAASSRIDVTGNPLCIGKQSLATSVQGFNIPGEFYKGLLDEMWMFGRGLAPAELNSLIQASYNPVRLNP